MKGAGKRVMFVNCTAMEEAVLGLNTVFENGSKILIFVSEASSVNFLENLGK